jgi:hypothetical protein
MGFERYGDWHALRDLGQKGEKEAYAICQDGNDV